jgi:3-dehydroquinate dehydratase / shikimate dehydrogenase
MRKTSQFVQSVFSSSYDATVRPNPKTDIIELRFDDQVSLSRKKIKKITNTLRAHFSGKMMLTIRSQAQGGGSLASNRFLYAYYVWQLAKQKPEYLDIELGMPRWLIHLIHFLYPKTHIIYSYHLTKNFNINMINESVKKLKKLKFAYYKVAAQVTLATQALQMMTCHLNHRCDQLTSIAMGEMGEITRILAKKIGCHFIYTPLLNATAPGQLTLNQLLNQYHIDRQNQATKIYALIGNPVQQSVGNIFHNQLFEASKQNKVYVKIALENHELATFYNLAARLDILGLSVTMPYKGLVSKVFFLKGSKIVNTLYYHKRQWVGVNTDVIALRIILTNMSISMSNKSIMVMGSGSMAQLMIDTYAGKAKHIYQVTRTPQAKKHRLSYADLNQCFATNTIDVIINATPLGMPHLQHDTTLNEHLFPLIHPEHIVIDWSYHPDLSVTQLIQQAKFKSCLYIDGKALFEQQAILQQHHWFKK